MMMRDRTEPPSPGLLKFYNETTCVICGRVFWNRGGKHMQYLTCSTSCASEYSRMGPKRGGLR
jgi:hypothetical protein